VEYISRGRRLTRRLPKERGGLPILVSPEAGGLKYWRKSLTKADPELLSLARELVHPNFVVWDIGANQGIFSLSAAWLAGLDGLVIAIEPDPMLASLLADSCALSAHMARAPVAIVPLAVSDSIGQQQFHIARRARASNHLEGFGNSQSGRTRETLPVLTVTLDWLSLYLPPPQLLKIDVEGAELSVLRGAATLLRKYRPILICEVSDQNSAESAQVLLSHDYVIYDGSAKPNHRRRLNRCPWQTIAIPEEPGKGRGEAPGTTGRTMDIQKMTERARESTPFQREVMP